MQATLDDSARARLADAQASLASKGQRVILLAKKVVPAKTASDIDFADEDSLSLLAHDLVAVGLAALVDPPRSDTKETVETCRRAGIKFMMGTLDLSRPNSLC